MTDAKWKMVPIEPTDEMLLAAGEPYDGHVPRKEGLALRRMAYQKIIEAAPKPPVFGYVAPPISQADEAEVQMATQTPMVFFRCLQHAERIATLDPKVGELVGPDGFIARDCPFCSRKMQVDISIEAVRRIPDGDGIPAMYACPKHHIGRVAREEIRDPANWDEQGYFNKPCPFCTSPTAIYTKDIPPPAPLVISYRCGKHSRSGTAMEFYGLRDSAGFLKGPCPKCEAETKR